MQLMVRRQNQDAEGYIEHFLHHFGHCGNEVCRRYDFPVGGIVIRKRAQQLEIKILDKIEIVSESRAQCPIAEFRDTHNANLEPPI